MMGYIRDVPRPQIVCPNPDCKSADLFWHCARQDDRGVYDWGTIITCNKCGLDFSLSTVTPAVVARLPDSDFLLRLPIYGTDEDRYQGFAFKADATVIYESHEAVIDFRRECITLTTGTLSFKDAQRIASTITAYIKAARGE